ncbi:MAG TPA: 16S rRNA (guanine(527)-N(7))-methyltransferase RsmG [Bacteroidaceae bacterium]|nr:16S rRNA (guanine(527)-N(7))-methyltransferase RsmG [Bacteroidaceae bacterium]
MELINKYFPQLTDRQKYQFEKLYELYSYWNSKINVISRKDIENLYKHHVLHSLAIAKMTRFVDGTKIIDVGTGGGFPGIPLAILFPECKFTLVDSIGKKIRVAIDIATNIDLKNVTCRHERAEDEKDKFEFLVSRAVMPLSDLYILGKRLINKKEQKNSYPNGLLCLKGGQLVNEIAPYKKASEVMNISSFFQEEYFIDKKVVYIQI